ncbi:transmembrane protein 178B-like [Gigantopelta aegis]|uniref:transmembrane protein 178B-like n=1 Tax=Gigantopelta aegis TaxID=1735272 RepID=UPI001B889FCF|nr:transmembrane protein 178B-like [Gigantopelta aegis]
MGACATALIVIATILGPITLVFIAVSFGTDNWLVYTVKSDVSKTNPSNKPLAVQMVYHSRNQGLFRICYPGNDTKFLDNAQGVVDRYCFNVDYEVPETVSNPSDEYMARIHLNRLWLAFYIVAIVTFICAYIFGLVLCCWRISRWAYVAGLCAYIAAFSVAAAIAFFHGAEYLERNKITGYEQFYQGWPSTLKDGTNRKYGWSYIIGWVGMILAAFTATFYSLAGCYITSGHYEDSREILEKPSRHSPHMMMEPMYTLDDPYYAKYAMSGGYPRGGYVGPYMYGPDGRPLAHAPAIAYPGDPHWQFREA